jgi:hypothetical protein
VQTAWPRLVRPLVRTHWSRPGGLRWARRKYPTDYQVHDYGKTYDGQRAARILYRRPFHFLPSHLVPPPS